MRPQAAVKRAPSAVSPLTLKRMKTDSPGSGRVRNQSRFTWVRAGSEPTAGGADSGPIRRGRVSPLGKASSRYQWVSRVQRAESRPRPGLKPGLRAGLKAGPVSPKASLSPRGRSRFRWSAPRRTEPATAVATETRGVATETGGSAGFKLRSRTKIIRRSSPAEIRTPCGPKPGPRPRVGPRSGPGRTLITKHRLRRVHPGLNSCKVSSSPVSSPKALVSVSRHRLRRVSRTPETRTRTRTSRFKMDKRSVALPAATASASPNTSWRRHKVLNARSVPQGRLRTAPPRGQSHMCWIRGALFTVSANRLSRATPTRRSAGSSPFSRHSPGSAPFSRHLARSALQRSLSVARSLKKKPRQFCIFYNRFGRCNRGDACAFIHDPDKVAVCTRFLRGRCKDGENCPFSHKVSKDKMPVCSFFLKGMCMNTDCVYSHVYVNRKAQVCEDFLRGYCPEGQKCKKKHTLFCADPNCLRGNACKLQHKRPIKRSTAKKPRPHSTRSKPQSPGSSDPTAAPDLSAAQPSARSVGPGPGPGPGLSPGSVPALIPAVPQTLPSFISLCSSPEEPDTPPTTGGAVLARGRSLQIKPRLNLNS